VIFKEYLVNTFSFVFMPHTYNVLVCFLPNRERIETKEETKRTFLSFSGVRQLAITCSQQVGEDEGEIQLLGPAVHCSVSAVRKWKFSWGNLK